MPKKSPSFFFHATPKKLFSKIQKFSDQRVVFSSDVFIAFLKNYIFV